MTQDRTEAIGIDLANGMEASREQALTAVPELWRYAENFLFTGYDPELDMGLWFHLGSTPDDSNLWEDQIYITLPHGQGILWSMGYAMTPTDQRPAGPQFKAACIEPFKRWKLTGYGRAVISPVEEQFSGRLRDGSKEVYSFDLDVECVTPAWDVHGSAARHGERFEEQAWASWHYEQLYRITGTVRWRDQEVQFRGTGWRDHSRGQRGHAYEKYGGHNLFSALFPSGKAFGLMEMWNPEGQVNLSVGYIFDGRQMHYGKVLQAVRLTEILPAGEPLSFTLQLEDGREPTFHGEIVNVMLSTQTSPYGMAWGADTGYGRGIYAPSTGRWDWDGKCGYGLSERSNRFGQQRP
jgi:hypothetical protein